MNKEEEFIQKIKEIYPNDFENISSNLYKQPNKAFRINKLKANESEVIEFLKENKIEVEKNNLVDAFILKNLKDKISETKLATDNLIYIQEFSSMLPGLVLEPKANENILDMCAAPGSKTSQIANLTLNKANIYVVEKDRNRFFKMQNILKEQGVLNVNCILSDANRLIKIKPEFENFFDKILLDAPCTNEASINLTDSLSLKYWLRKKAKEISKLQKGLINSAIKMLKPNGILVYSTCTYSVEENEMVVDWILEREKNLQLEDIKVNLKNIRNGLVRYKEKELNSNLNKSIRIIPDGNFKAFYIAKIKKNS